MRPPASWPVVCLLACAAGCRSLSAPLDPAAPRAEAAAKPAARTIAVDLVFARFDDRDPAWRDELWAAVDEQALDDGLRRRLAANGLRAGIVAGDLPPHLAERMLPERAGPAAEATEPDPPLTHRSLRLLPGRRGEVVAAAGLDELVLLEDCDGRVRGGTFHDATGLFELKVRPAADGRVRIDVTPEIRHGPLERSWVGEDGMFRMEAGQRRHRRDDLAVGIEVREGAVLVVGCTGDEGATLGDALLRDHRGDRSTMRLLLIRPAGRTVDPMFADPAAGEDAGAEDVLPVR